jgi:hypothetical protein
MKKLFVIILLGLASSCLKKPTAQSSRAKGDDTGILTVCKCNDIACWQKETQARSIDSFKCAKDAIGTIFPVVDIPLSIGAAGLEIYSAASELKEAVELLKEGSQFAKIIKEAAPDCASAIAEHVGGISSLISKSLDSADKFKKVADRAQAGEINFTLIFDTLNAASDPAIEVAKFAEGSVKLAKCIEDAPDSNTISEVKSTFDKFKKSLWTLQKPWSELSVLKKIDIVGKGIKCGVAIVKGAGALVQNTLCLADDFAELDRQRGAIKDQTDKLAQSKPLSWNSMEKDIKANPNLCLNQERDNSITLMGKFGADLSSRLLKLNDEDRPDYAIACANNCGDNGKSSYCTNFLSSVDAGIGCKDFCSLKQMSSATAICVSTCCRNSEVCYRIATQRAGLTMKQLDEAKNSGSGNAASMGQYCGDGEHKGANREMVRDQNATYVFSSAPPYESCSACCMGETFEGGSKLDENDKSGCTNVCILAGRNYGKKLRDY